MSKTDSFIAHAIDIANDNAHGYSQYQRWGLDYDCSSLMYECGYYAGYDLPKRDPRYTGTMINDFKSVGFTVRPFDGLDNLKPGDILLNEKYHTAVYIGNGRLVEASIAETGGVHGATGDQTGHEIHIRSVYNYPWTHILTPPKEEYIMPISDEDAKKIARYCAEYVYGNQDKKENLNMYNAVHWGYRYLQQITAKLDKLAAKLEKTK